MGLLNAAIANPKLGGPSYTVKHRIFRCIWNLAWAAFASWTPPPLHKWRVFLLRVFGAKVHWTAHIYGSARVWYPPNLEMLEHSCLGPRVLCYNMAPIHVGKHAVISQGAHLCAGQHDIYDANFQLVTRSIVISDEVWIAAEAFIGPGVAVGERAVIGARAVLFSDADSRGVYVGNPAQRTKSRDSSY